MPTTLAQRIRKSREKANLSRKQVAEHICVSEISVGHWERGTNKAIKSKHLFVLARMLGVDAEWLANGRKAG